MKIREIIDFFFNSTVKIKILVYLYINRDKTMYLMMVAKYADITYSYLKKEADKLEREGFITSVKSGREKYVRLTKKGEEVAKLLYKICKVLKNGNKKAGGVQNGR